METESANPFTCTKITFPRCAEESRPEAKAEVVVVGVEEAAAPDSTGTERPIGTVFAVTHTHAVEFLSLRVAVSVCVCVCM